jgi:hypothetical protein
MTSSRNRRSLLGSLEVQTLLWIGVCAGIAFAATAAEATGVVPDNGSGTIALPPGDYQALASQITDGLPLGTSIEVTAWLKPAGATEVAGGSLGGNVETWNSVVLDLELTGTGALAGFTRSISIPGVFVETHSGPRNVGSSPQNITQDLFMMQGQISGDPDFDLLRITAGTDFGMPSPGQTTLTDLGGGNWFVDSFFDITHRFDFVGAPGGPLDGMSGSTTATDRYTFVPEPPATALGAIALASLAVRRRFGR